MIKALSYIYYGLWAIIMGVTFVACVLAVIAFLFFV